MRGCLSDPFAITWTYFIFTLTDIRDSTAVHERKWIPICSHFLVHLPAGNTFRNWMREDGFLPFSHIFSLSLSLACWWKFQKVNERRWFPPFLPLSSLSCPWFRLSHLSFQVDILETFWITTDWLERGYILQNAKTVSVLVWPVHWETSSSGQKQPVQTSPCDEEMPSLKVWGGVCVCGGRQK